MNRYYLLLVLFAGVMIIPVSGFAENSLAEQVRQQALGTNNQSLRPSDNASKIYYFDADEASVPSAETNRSHANQSPRSQSPQDGIQGYSDRCPDGSVPLLGQC